MAEIESWVCPTCNNEVLTPFCPTCGEGAPTVRDLTLHGLFSQFLHAFSTIDRRLLRSFRYLITQPGLLTVAYVQGQRVPYTGPFQIFLIANVLFFAMQYLTHTNIVSSTLDSHLYHQDWSALAQNLVANRLAAKPTTIELYTPVFNQAIVLYAKSLIILMVFPLAILLQILFYQNRQPFVAHVVFSLYFYTFLLLLFCLSLVAAEIDFILGGNGLNSAHVDNILSVFNLAASAVYLFMATGTVYGAKGKERIVKVILLTLTVGGILVGYRFLLFLITLYTT